VNDPEQMRVAIERWVKELQPGASGWLGTTAGVTDDGRFIALARFESETAAQQNSDRPEQGDWWAVTSKLFSSDPVFSNSTHVTVDVNGDPDTAGFVQVMQGRGSDPERAREIMSDDSIDWAAFRPEIIGTVSVEHAGGAYTMAIYFTSEQAAREGEAKEMPPEVTAMMNEMNALAIGEPVFFDLKQPLLVSP
jgi:hypothetical protein